jgi:putative DNA primase/helicase
MPQGAKRPVIEAQGGTLPYMVAEAEAALLAAGVPIYQRAFLVRPTEQQFDAADGRKTHSAVLVAVTAPYLLKLLAKVALWRKYDGRKKKLVACNPPNDVVNILLASRGDWAFPVIRGVITCPTLRPDGSLLTTSGYDRRTRYFLSRPTDLALPPIPDRPSREEAEAALARLDKLLDGFPFEDEVSRSVALTILMTPALRVAMDMSPLLGVSAKSPGTGKSFLVDLATTIALGRFCPVMGPGKDDKETEKRIDTNLISGMSVFSIDNVHRPLDLVALNTATERPLLTIRLFGTLTNVEVENSVTIFMTGNNLAIVGEQGRRTVRACMDAKEEQPERRDFPLGNPIEAVLKDRGSYIADILTIARAYHVSGSPRPAGLNPFGSYPGWSHFVREPLVWLGRPDPVASQEAARADDPTTIKLRAVIDAWYGAFGMGAMTLAKAVQYATTPPVFTNNEDMTEPENRAVYSTHKEYQEALLATDRHPRRGARCPAAASAFPTATGHQATLAASAVCGG